MVASMNGGPPTLLWLGFALLIGVGPILCLSGGVLYAVRRPTPEELARQKLDDSRTWQFRPAGLIAFALLAVFYLGAVFALGSWPGGIGLPAIVLMVLLNAATVLLAIAAVTHPKLRGAIFYLQRDANRASKVDESNENKGRA
jgi:hypothetical protein